MELDWTILVVCMAISGLIFVAEYLGIKWYYNRENGAVDVSAAIKDISRNDTMSDYWETQRTKDKLYKRLIAPLMDNLLVYIKQFTPDKMYKEAELLVDKADGFHGLGVIGFFTVCLVSMATVFAISVFFVLRMHGNPAFRLGIVMFSFILGYALPYTYIRKVIEAKQEAIRLSLPDMLDLLCVSVQAGLGFDAALSKVVEKMQGPLANNCERLLQELRMGVSRREALVRLAKRCDIEEMKMFTASLIQAEVLGVGMAEVLKIQSENMRDSRRQKARQRAAKLSTKIMAPTVVFIFPVMFVVVLGPSLVNIMAFLAKK